MQDEVFSYASPLGELSYVWDGKVCSGIQLLEAPAGGSVGNDPVRAWLDAYFSGAPLPLPPIAIPRSSFQASMREALLAIPFGETRTYGEIAASLCTAPRAMGQALGANPLPLLIPCHRVVAVTGIGGFSCGLDWKRRLLGFESGGTDF